MPGDRLALRPELRRHAHDETARLVGILGQNLDHLIDRDVIVVGMPAIVIGHHGDERRKATPPRARAWLPASPSCRSPHSPRSDRDWIPQASRIADLPWRDRCRRAHAGCLLLCSAASSASASLLQIGWAIETCATKPGPKKLFSRAKVRSMNWSTIDEGAGRQILAQRAAGRNRDHVRHARALQRVDIGAVVDRAGRLDMAAAVARQEDEIDALKAAEQEIVRGLAPGRFHAFPAPVFETGNVIDAAAADDAENCLAS